MQTFNSTTLLETLQQQTEEILQIAIRDWQMMPPAAMGRTPQHGGWSASQCLSHLNGYGLYYLPLLRNALGHPKRKETFTPGWLGDYFTKSMEPDAAGKAKSKMKAFKQHVPPAGERPEEVLALFIEQQEEIIQLLERAKGADIGRRAIPVSIAPFIRLKTGDTFRFLIAHNRRHVAQALRALQGSAAKAAA